jgi:hypothetical protein
VTVQPDTDPRTIEWARKPPAPLLEALETLHGLFDHYRQTAVDTNNGRLTKVEWIAHAFIAYQTAYNVMLRAFAEEYAP